MVRGGSPREACVWVVRGGWPVKHVVGGSWWLAGEACVWVVRGGSPGEACVWVVRGGSPREASGRLLAYLSRVLCTTSDVRPGDSVAFRNALGVSRTTRANGLDAVSGGGVTVVEVEQVFDIHSRPHRRMWSLARRVSSGAPVGDAVLPTRRCPMTRRHHDPVVVRGAAGSRPASVADGPRDFVWRGRRYTVCAVLDSWQERRAWWREVGDHPARPRAARPAEPAAPGLAGRGPPTVRGGRGVRPGSRRRPLAPAASPRLSSARPTPGHRTDETAAPDPPLHPAYDTTVP